MDCAVLVEPAKRERKELNKSPPRFESRSWTKLGTNGFVNFLLDIQSKAGDGGGKGRKISPDNCGEIAVWSGEPGQVDWTKLSSWSCGRCRSH